MGSNLGLVHVYCGDGKGKTTAAIGLAVRAAGAGMKVCFCQLMKTGDSSELEPLGKINGIELRLSKNEFGFTWKMSEDEKKSLTRLNNQVLEELIDSISTKKYDVVVFDEIMSAYNNCLIDKERVIYMLDNHEGVELVLTGRNPEKEISERADYVSEMKKLSHPYEKGVNGRLGIEFR